MEPWNLVFHNRNVSYKLIVPPQLQVNSAEGSATSFKSYNHNHFQILGRQYALMSPGGDQHPEKLLDI